MCTWLLQVVEGNQFKHILQCFLPYWHHIPNKASSYSKFIQFIHAYEYMTYIFDYGNVCLLTLSCFEWVARQKCSFNSAILRVFRSCKANISYVLIFGNQFYSVIDIWDQCPVSTSISLRRNSDLRFYILTSCNKHALTCVISLDELKSDVFRYIMENPWECRLNFSLSKQTKNKPKIKLPCSHPFSCIFWNENKRFTHTYLFIPFCVFFN